MQELDLALNPWYFGSVCNDFGEKLPAQSSTPSFWVPLDATKVPYT